VRIGLLAYGCREGGAREAERQVVFFAVGFETTAQGMQWPVWQARARVSRISRSWWRMCSCRRRSRHSERARVPGTGLPRAGHVCTVVGFERYEPIAQRLPRPIVVTGFEPLDLLEGTPDGGGATRKRARRGGKSVQRAVSREGNLPPKRWWWRSLKSHRQWRGIGEIPGSGCGCAGLPRFDAEERFALTRRRSGTRRSVQRLVLQGLKSVRMLAFAAKCTPERPLGAPMVLLRGRLRSILSVRKA